MEDEDSRVRNDYNNGEEADLSQLAEVNDVSAVWASYYDDYSDVSMIGGKQTEGDVEHTVIICEFLLDFVLSKSNLLGDFSALRGYLRGRSGL